MAETVSQKLLLEVETSTRKATADLKRLKELLKDTGKTGGDGAAAGFDKVSASADRSTKAIRDTITAVKAGKIPEDKAQARIQKRIKLLEALRAQQGLSLKQRTKLDAAMVSSAAHVSKANLQTKTQTGALSAMNNMSTKSVFAISNMAQTFQLASGPAHQMKFVFGQIMDQFALMGPKGLLVGGVVAGLGFLSTRFKGTAKAADDSFYEIRSASAALKDQLGDDFTSAQDVLEEFSKELKHFGMTAREIRIAMAEETIAAMQTELPFLEDKRNKAMAEMGEAQIKLSELFQNLEQQKAKTGVDAQAQLEHLEDISREIGAQRNLLKEMGALEKTYREGVQDTTREIERQTGAISKAKETQEKLIALELAKKGKTGPRGKMADDEMPEGDAGQSQSEIWHWLETKKTDEAEKGADDRSKIAKKEWDYKASLMQAGTSLASSLLAESIKITLSGEKNMGEALLKMFLERTGQSLIAIGTRAVFEGAVMNASLPGSGVAAMATGAAAIAAGAAMSAGAAAMTVGGATGAGDAGGAEENGSGGGVSTGGFGGTNEQAGTGTTIINISYGVGGPNPEDAAQAVLDAIALGGRRGLEGRA